MKASNNAIQSEEPDNKSEQKAEKEGKFNEMHHITAQSKTIQAIRKKPRFGFELDFNPTPKQRNYIRSIRIPQSATGKNFSLELNNSKMYYFYGDDRRAVRRLIEESPELFDWVFEDKNRISRLQKAWPDYLVQIALEEWGMKNND